MKKILFFLLISLIVVNSLMATDQAESWQFVVLGDSRSGEAGSGVNEAILGILAREIAAHKPALVLFNGDLFFGHANRQRLGDAGALARIEQELRVWMKVMAPVYEAHIPVYVVRGNHEVTQYHPNCAGQPEHRPVWPKTTEIWNQVFSGQHAMPANGPDHEKNLTYSFTYQNALIIGMDVYTPQGDFKFNPDSSILTKYVHRVAQPWLDQQLAQNQVPHVFVFTHEPAFKLEHPDCLHGDMAYGLDLSEARDAFWKSLRKANARVYFCGHDHGYAHARIDDGDGQPENDIHQLVVGSAGAGKDLVPNYNGYNTDFTPVPITHDQSYGYMLGVVEGLSVHLTYYRMTDEQAGKFEVFDQFRYTLSAK